MLKNACIGLFISSFIFSASSVKADDDFSVEDGINLGKAIVDLATNGGKGWGPNPGGGGGWPGGGGGFSGGAVYTPNGSAVYPGQTIYENGYKYWRCGNPGCYKLHSQYVGGGMGGGGMGGGMGGPGIMEFRVGVTLRSVGNGVVVTGFTHGYNNGNLRIGDKIVQARLSDGRIVNIRNINDFNRAKTISGSSGSMQVRLYSANYNAYVVRNIVIMGEGSGGHAAMDDGWDNNSNGFSP